MGTKSELVYELHINRLDNTQKELTSAILNHLDVEAIEETEDSLIIYHDNIEFVDQLEEQLLVLAQWIEKDQLSRTQRKNQNWNKAWESSFAPIIIGQFCTVKATFHEMKNSTTYVITIDPEMAFGTGHHETTHAMIEMMESVSFNDKQVLDYGTGTAILAILAEQLGANHVFAFDYDEVAIECAIRCVALNDCRLIDCATSVIDDLDKNNKYDIVLANINRNVLIEKADELYQRHEHGGVLLLSGILENDKDLVLETYVAIGYQLTNEIQRGEWLCLRLEKM